VILKTDQRAELADARSSPRGVGIDISTPHNVDLVSTPHGAVSPAPHGPDRAKEFIL
jgi:hypothetical protein